MARVNNNREAIAQLQKTVNEAEGPVLADEFIGLVPLSGRQLYFQPFEFKQLSVANVWDETAFIDDINHKEWALILLYDPPTWNSIGERWTEAQILAIETNYTKVGRYADTIIYKPTNLQINPESAESHYKLGMTYLNKGQMGQTIEHFKIAVRLQPNNPIYRNFLGITYGQKGSYDDAIEQFEIAVQLAPLEPAYRRNLDHAQALKNSVGNYKQGNDAR